MVYEKIIFNNISVNTIITLSLKKQIPCDAFELFRMFTEKQPISAKKVLYMFFSYL